MPESEGQHGLQLAIPHPLCLHTVAFALWVSGPRLPPLRKTPVLPALRRLIQQLWKDPTAQAQYVLL